MQEAMTIPEAPIEVEDPETGEVLGATEAPLATLARVAEAAKRRMDEAGGLRRAIVGELRRRTTTEGRTRYLEDPDVRVKLEVEETDHDPGVLRKLWEDTAAGWEEHVAELLEVVEQVAGAGDEGPVALMDRAQLLAKAHHDHPHRHARRLLRVAKVEPRKRELSVARKTTGTEALQWVLDVIAWAERPSTRMPSIKVEWRGRS